MKRPIRKSKQKGIEISYWKVGEADDFQGLNVAEEIDVEPTPSEYYEANAVDESRPSPSADTYRGN